MATTYTPGKYRAEIIDQGFGTSSVKGIPYFFLQVKVLARCDDIGQSHECPKFERTVEWYLAKEINVNILKGNLKALGVEITALAQLDLQAPDAINLTGRQIEVVCEHEGDDGKVRERWRISRSRNKLDLGAISALDATFGHLLRKGETTPAPNVTQPSESDQPS